MRTRRKFVFNCSALAVSAAILPASAVRWTDITAGELGFQSFAAELNSRFLTRSGPGQSLELVEATRKDSTAGHFSLLFRGDATQPLDQNTYRFEHARLGRFEMFIVPVGRPGETHCYYEAVFNRS